MVSIMQLAFQEGRLPEAMTWTEMVLMSKEEGYFRGIGLVEVIWKVLTSITNNRLRYSVTLYDALHEFRQGRGTGMATLKTNMVQHLAGVFKDPLFQVFLDVRKACGLLYRKICMEVLNGYGLGPKLRRLLQWVLEEQAVVPKTGRYYG